MRRNAPSFLPLPLPGEALYSLVARYHSLTAQADGETTQRLFGTPTLSPILPRGLDRLLEAVEGAWGTIEQIIERHTAYPYLAHFVTPTLAQQVIDRMRAVPGVAPRRVVAFEGWRVDRVRNLRMCPLCVSTQSSDHGTAYWTTSHQLPAVVVCHEHHADLVDACPQCGPFARQRLALPLPHVSCPTCGHTHTVTYRLRQRERFGDEALTFARMTHELLQGALPAMSVEARIRLYRVKAEQLGAPTNQPIRWLESQASRYRPALLRELGVLKDGAIKLPMTFLRDSKGIAHPALHLLAIDIMFGSLAAYQAEATLLVAEMQRQAELDLIKTLRQHEYDLVAASAAMSRSAQSVVDELIESGVDVTQQFHMFDERRQKLISSGLSAGTVERPLSLVLLLVSLRRREYSHSRQASARRQRRCFLLPAAAHS